MTAIFFGKIYSSKDTVPLQAGCHLCDKQVKFLNPILLSSTSIEQDIQNSTLKVTFFHGSRFSQTLLFRSYQVNELFTNKADLNTTLYSQFGKESSLANLMMTTDTQEIDDLLIKNASWFIRGSETLDKDKLVTLSNEWRAIDGRGMALFEKFDSPTSLYRLIFLVMLALAYNLALQKMNEKLSSVLIKPDNMQELDTLYIETAIFNARYYFNNPIEFSRYPTFKAWRDISAAYHLNEKNVETISQLTQVHQILSYTKQKEEQHINETRNWKLAIFGVILSVLGIIEVIDIIKNWLA